MARLRHPRYGFADSETLVVIAVAGLSLGIFLPAMKRSLDLGLSWWLSILLGLGLVALFWIAFATVSMVVIQIAMWLERSEQ